MGSMNLVHPDAAAELVERLTGARIKCAEVERDVNGASRARIRLVLDNGLTFSFAAGPLKSALLEGDVPLPQWVGTGEQHNEVPQRLEAYALRAVK